MLDVTSYPTSLFDVCFFIHSLDGVNIIKNSKTVILLRKSTFRFLCIEMNDLPSHIFSFKEKQFFRSVFEN